MHHTDRRLEAPPWLVPIVLLALLVPSACAHSGSAAGDANGAPDGGASPSSLTSREAQDQDAAGAAAIETARIDPPADPTVALARLVAIQEIEQLKARFMRCVDTKDLVCLRDEVFAPGAEIRFIGSDYEFAASGWTAIEKLYQDGFSAQKFGMHHAHTPEITVDGQTARGKWYLHDVFVNLEEGWTLQGSALYDDTYAKIDGRWRIMYSTYRRLWEETTPRDPRTRLGSKPIAD
ncbi:MAG: nuclear transport factor 2 family protein [Myxococcota bacterium]